MPKSLQPAVSLPFRRNGHTEGWVPARAAVFACKPLERSLLTPGADKAAMYLARIDRGGLPFVDR